MASNPRERIVEAANKLEPNCRLHADDGSALGDKHLAAAREALTVLSETEAVRTDEPTQQEKDQPMKSGWQEKHRWPPFTHGRVVCACGHVVAQCRCPQGCEVVGTVDTCEKCAGERRTLPVVPTAVEAKSDTNLIHQSAPAEPPITRI